MLIGVDRTSGVCRQGTEWTGLPAWIDLPACIGVDLSAVADPRLPACRRRPS
jgi:hypothetical protein